MSISCRTLPSYEKEANRREAQWYFDLNPVLYKACYSTGPFFNGKVKTKKKNYTAKSIGGTEICNNDVDQIALIVNLLKLFF